MDILQINPDTLADRLQIRHVLSPGRNDGIASMTRQIQQQLQLYNIHNNTNTTKSNTVLPPSSSSIRSTPTTITTSGNDTIQEMDDLFTMIDSSSSSSSLVVEDYESEGPIRVAMLLSGGVDSSVALALLASQPETYHVTAFYLKIWLDEELGERLGQQCPWEDDVTMCREVCDQLHVPLEIVSLSQQYHNRVISYTLQEAQKGRTPNPDIMCNSRIKFGTFYDYAIQQRQFQYIASGHYAQNTITSTATTPTTTTEQNDDTTSSSSSLVFLSRSPDPVKDQSYFLSALTQQQLSKVLFPIGHYEKHQVRELANDVYALPNRHRPDSQGLCFLGKVKFDSFLNAYLGTNPGPILDVTSNSTVIHTYNNNNNNNNDNNANNYNKTIGQHSGLWYHTVGQRKGLGKALYPKITSQGPWYVVAKNPKTNTLLVSNQYEQSDEFNEPRSQFTVEDLSWITDTHNLPLVDDPTTNDHDDVGSSSSSSLTMRLDMKIRHGPNIVQGTLTLSSNPNTNNNNNDDIITGNIKLDNKDGGLAPGQFVAFYRLDSLECLGSGVISEHHWSNFLSQQQDNYQPTEKEVEKEKEKTTPSLIPNN